MIQIVYWGLELYSASVPEAKGAIDGLVAQSKALLLKEWRGCKRRISHSFELSISLATKAPRVRRQRVDAGRQLRRLGPLRLRELRGRHSRRLRLQLRGTAHV